MTEISKEVLAAIEAEALQKTGELRLPSLLGLTEIPDEVFELEHLSILKLPMNQIGSIPSKLERLQNIEVLDLSANGLTQFPDVITKLPKLKSLDLGFNRIELSPVLAKLNLTQLSLTGLHLTEIPDWLREMRTLRILNLGYNELRDLSLLSELPRLQELGVGPTTQLDLESLAGLSKLIGLTLLSCGLSTLPSSFSRLSSLQRLWLYNNNFSIIPDVVYELKSLEILSFNNTVPGTSGKNAIKEVPSRISELPRLSVLDLTDNPVEVPPVEVVARGVASIIEYYKQIDQAGTDHLYEAKLLIVGEGGSGKTTLVHKILDPNYVLNPSEPTTEGIAVASWQFANPFHGRMESFTARIWDFGGQEIYHATHQFFLTKRSLYILVADNRREDTDFYYWLNSIETFSESSPTIILKNEKQDRTRELDDAQIRGNYPGVVAIIASNLATNRGLDSILSLIRANISELQHIGTELPKTWVTIRKALEEHPANYITADEFRKICADHDLNGTSDTDHLSEYLHDLGVCLHFGQDPLLKNIVILKPNWGTTAVYKLLDDKTVIANMGMFKRNELAIIWHEAQYAEMQDELLQLMLNFKLCYRIPEDSDIFIAPQLLGLIQPTYDWDATDNLNVRLAYEFMPKGILGRLIVAIHHLITNRNEVWRYGVVVQHDGARGEVVERQGDKEIRIRVAGQNKRQLLTIIIYEIEKINKSFKRLRYHLLVPCNCSGCKPLSDPEFYSFDMIQKFATDRQNIQCRKSYEMVDVSRLIDDVRYLTTAPTREEFPGFFIQGNVSAITINRGPVATAGGVPKEGAMGDTKVRSAWANGSFYLFAFAVVAGIFGYFALALPAYSLAVIVIAGAVLVPIIGALQLRQDDRLSQKPFLELMRISVSQLPLLQRLGKSEEKEKH